MGGWVCPGLNPSHPGLNPSHTSTVVPGGVRANMTGRQSL